MGQSHNGFGILFFAGFFKETPDIDQAPNIENHPFEARPRPAKGSILFRQVRVATFTSLVGSFVALEGTGFGICAGFGQVDPYVKAKLKNSTTTWWEARTTTKQALSFRSDRGERFVLESGRVPSFFSFGTMLLMQGSLTFQLFRTINSGRKAMEQAEKSNFEGEFH